MWGKPCSLMSLTRHLIHSSLSSHNGETCLPPEYRKHSSLYHFPYIKETEFAHKSYYTKRKWGNCKSCWNISRRKVEGVEAGGRVEGGGSFSKTTTKLWKSSRSAWSTLLVFKFLLKHENKDSGPLTWNIKVNFPTTYGMSVLWSL